MFSPRPKADGAETFRLPRLGSWVLIATVGAFFWSGVHFRAEEFDQPVGALLILEKAFRANNADAFRSLLRAESKVFISSNSLGMTSSYYGRDQIFFIVRNRFRSIKTLSFKLSGENRLPERARELRTIGRWLYRDGRGQETWAEIEFSLAKRDDVWYLREIRQKH